MKVFFTLFKRATSARLFVVKRGLFIMALLLFGFLVQAQQTVIVQAESGTLGSQYSSGIDAGNGYVSVASPLVDGNFPGANRIASYNITFPAAGVYDLYMRIKVGPGGGDDDSYFYGNGFGVKDPANGGQWITVNNVAGAGFSIPTDVITGAGSAGGGIWKWVKLTGQNFGEAGVSFTVPAGSLTQTFQIGGREDGLLIDKFAFTSPTGLFFTVALLDNGQTGFPTPPGEKFPVVFQAETGVLGTNFPSITQGANTYVSVTGNGGEESPGDITRINSYSVIFPNAGTYDLYARVRVSAGGIADDAFFYGNGFGNKSPTNADDWIKVDGLSNVGFSGQYDPVSGGGTAGLNTFKWIKLSEFNGGETPISFVVPAPNSTMTFQIGGKEDGLNIDKFAFGKNGVYFSVTNLDNIQQGITSPPFTPTGVPIAQGLTKFLGSAHSGGQAPFFANYWNQVTSENGGKWGTVEGSRDNMNWGQADASYNLAKANGFSYKHHALIWGNQQPAWIESLPAAEQLEEIREWYAAVAARYPDLEFVEVVNEPLHDPPRGATNGNYIEALGGNGATGWDWIIKSFELAREYFPNSKLVLNDYSIINDNNATTNYLVIINLLKERGLIDAIGEQGHAFSWTGTPSDRIANNLNRLAATGLPIYITELDIDGLDDQVQLNEYKRIFPILWDHPSVMGITLWGWRLGHWRTAQGDYLVNANGSERPALVWLREFVTLPHVTAGQSFSVSEKAAAGTAFGNVAATDLGPNTVFQDWKITGGTGASAFAINSTTGALTMLDNSTLDFESATRSYTLTITVSDSYHTSAPETITVNLLNANDNAPVVTASINFTLESCTEIGKVTATDADDANQEGFTSFQNWQIVGGTGQGVFSIDAATGMIAVANLSHVDLKKSSITLMVTVSDGLNTSAAQSVTISIPDKITVCHNGKLISVSKMAAIGHLQHGDCIGSCSPIASSSRSITPGRQNILENALIQVYPNPAREKININLGTNASNIRKVQIVDLSGRVVKEIAPGKSSIVSIPSNNLKPGTYLVRMQGTKIITQKIVVQ